MLYDVLIIGAGASGLLCGVTAALRGKRVLLLDHNKRPGQKILASGGGRCNFSNEGVSAENYISKNQDFCRSAISRFKTADILNFLDAHKIQYIREDGEKLFCKGSSRFIHSALVSAALKAGAKIFTDCGKISVSKGGCFVAHAKQETFNAKVLVVAAGGLSYKNLGATDLGHKLARRFGHKITEVRPGLVPLIFSNEDKERFKGLAGVSFGAKVSCGGKSFDGGVVLTHTGLSGPAILQISSYWRPGEKILVEFSNLPRRLKKVLKDTPHFEFIPSGTAGLDKAEVTVGGVSTDEISSKTMESKRVKGLYFIGEVLDVTGELGGYNLHWAWASGHAAGSCL